VRTTLAPFERKGESPFQVQSDLQELMQDLVGIVRTEDEMQRALGEIKKLRERAGKVGVPGNREYNPGWHTALDLNHLLTVSEAIARSALERKESRGAHFRDDFPNKDAGLSKINLAVSPQRDGTMALRRHAIPE